MKVKERATNFMIKLLKETEKRLPDVENIHKNINNFKPAKMFGNQRLTFSELFKPYNHLLDGGEINKLEAQYNKLPHALENLNKSSVVFGKSEDEVRK